MQLPDLSGKLPPAIVAIPTAATGHWFYAAGWIALLGIGSFAKTEIDEKGGVAEWRLNFSVKRQKGLTTRAEQRVARRITKASGNRDIARIRRAQKREEDESSGTRT